MGRAAAVVSSRGRHEGKPSVVSDEVELDIEDPLAGSPDARVLDHAAWMSLTGPHARFAQVKGRAARYPPDVSPFMGMDPDGELQAWDDLAALVGPGAVTVLSAAGISPPAEWEVTGRIVGVQMVATALRAEEDAEAVRLEPEDVPEMLDLVGRTKPGPFRPRTIEMGNYLGIRRGGALVAMAGERLHPPGWTEISAVCTDDSVRGQGLATRLVRAVATGIRGRGETPFLQATATNTNAIRLYENLGFTVRRRVVFQAVRVPGGRG
jgi:ribosomal protein S18 acetylase RimI-like enzyme